MTTHCIEENDTGAANNRVFTKPSMQRSGELSSEKQPETTAEYRSLFPSENFQNGWNRSRKCWSPSLSYITKTSISAFVMLHQRQQMAFFERRVNSPTPCVASVIILELVTTLLYHASSITLHDVPAMYCKVVQTLQPMLFV